MRVAPGEPEAGPWRAQAVPAFIADVLAALPRPGGRPAVLAVDGRSASGKSTIAARIASAVVGSAVVHTDDISWWESFFGWDDLLATHVLAPALRGEPVAYRPPAWQARERPGAILVPAGSGLLVLEGVGASRRSLLDHLDAAVWVQSDATEARRRGIERDGGDPAAESFWDEWQAEEDPFLAADQPWERAVAIVCGTPQATGVPHDPAADILIGHLPSRTRESPARW